MNYTDGPTTTVMYSGMKPVTGPVGLQVYTQLEIHVVP